MAEWVHARIITKDASVSRAWGTRVDASGQPEIAFNPKPKATIGLNNQSIVGVKAEDATNACST